MTTEIKVNANDQLSDYTGTDGYHKWLGGLIVTDGIQALGEMYQCYWLIDIIASYQHTLKNQPFQVWKWEKTGKDKGIVTCEDGNKNVLKKQKINYTDIEADTCEIWVEDNVVLLPSEH